MRKKCSKYSFVFIFIIMAIAITANITYADSDIPQSSEDIPSNWAKAEIDKAIEYNLLPEKIQGAYRINITREEFSGVEQGLTVMTAPGWCIPCMASLAYPCQE